MDILGIGTEIIECLRIGRMIEQHGERFLTRVYTEREIRDCHVRKRAIEHFAVRWAAKEAVLKAIGTGIGRQFGFTDIEINMEDSGKPRVLLTGPLHELAERQGIGKFLLSMAHCRAYAMAHVLALRA